MSRPAVRGAFFAAAAFAAALAAAPAAAQGSPTPAAPPAAQAAPASKPAAVDPAMPTASQGEGRELNHHLFMPASLVSTPFAVTSFATEMILTAGKTTATATVAETTFSGTMQYAGLGAYFKYEYAFLDHFSARVWLNDLVYSGTTGQSVVVIGTEVHGGAGAGLTGTLKLGDAVRLGALLDVSYAPNFALTIGNALRTLADSCRAGNCDVNAASATSLENVLAVQPGLSVAWAPLAPLGITAAATYIYADTNGAATTSSGVQLATAVDFDFEPAVHVPVGLGAQLSWTAPVGSSSLQHATDVGGGLYYTGKRDLALGLQLLARRFSIQPGVTATTWSAAVMTIGLRYYW